MAGLGGFIGYILGGIDWDSLKFGKKKYVFQYKIRIVLLILLSTFSGELMGGHVRAVFTLVTFLFIGCISYTVSSFKEMPLKLLKSNQTRILITAADDVG